MDRQWRALAVDAITITGHGRHGISVIGRNTGLNLGRSGHWHWVAAVPGFFQASSFADGDGGDDQAGDRSAPGPSEQAVEPETDQQHCGQVGAQQGLFGIGHR